MFATDRKTEHNDEATNQPTECLIGCNFPDGGFGENELADYPFLRLLGAGAFGEVYLAIHTETATPYAVKRIPIQYEDEGVPSTAIREISLLRELDHPNIIKLHYVFGGVSMLYLVFEYLDMDLKMYLDTHGPICDRAMLQYGWLQCTRGLGFCHLHRILHRDLKPQNVLVHMETFRIKIADFGLARAFTMPLREYTHQVVTLWYRAPEILLGQQKYATPTDVWSLGCILAEMALARAILYGSSEIEMIFKIFQLLGTPDETVWPGVSKLRHFKTRFPQWRRQGLDQLLVRNSAVGDDGVAVIRECLTYDPVARPSCQALLNFPFFNGADAIVFGQSPLACKPSAGENSSSDTQGTRLRSA
eukprot:TRINITY_DN50978_c0_g1_i1.p1 TRINITY_DN50978_c0_g1~~TRINITY_DN50978_c0_g1_i1.p1  ORF type:complete len:361 (+),score=43.58 TRINITY_DN50978_c0_g1_i1:123-1205(+)